MAWRENRENHYWAVVGSHGLRPNDARVGACQSTGGFYGQGVRFEN